MFVRRNLCVLFFVAFAYGGPLFGRNPKDTCNVDKIQCCQNVSTPNSPDVLSSASNPTLLGLLASLPVNAPIGMGCTVAGAGSGTGCNANPMCCENAFYQDGLVNVGCAPIDFGEL